MLADQQTASSTTTRPSTGKDRVRTLPQAGGRFPRVPTPKIVFIAGLHRSGTTVLDRLLGDADGCFPAGELHHLWRGLVLDFNCGCGEPLRTCAFWNDVRSEAFGSQSIGESREVVEFQHRRLHSRPLQLARLVRQGRATPGREGRDLEFSHYADLLERLYGAVRSVSGAEVVVDSSKGPQDAYLLARLSEVEPYVVHIVRDPRAIAYSNTRPIANPAAPTGFMPSPPAVINAVRWLTWNTVLELLVKPATLPRYLRISYEDFAARPAATAREIYALIGHPHEEIAVSSDGTAEFGLNHSVAGNWGLFARRSLKITPDLAWHDEARARTKLLATMFGLPLLRRYGYPLNPFHG
jgi:hypothetical protein